MRQRNLFFGSIPQHAAPKCGQNKPLRERRFTGLSPDRIEVHIDYRDGGRRLQLRGLGERPAAVIKRVRRDANAGG